MKPINPLAPGANAPPELVAVLEYLRLHAPQAAEKEYSRYFLPDLPLCVVVARRERSARDLASLYDGLIGGHVRASGIITLRPQKG